jgi:2-dehydropantoate 2-reductase
MPERMAVVGAGAIGGLVGGVLTEAGYDIDLVDANREHVEAIRGEGLRIEGVRDLHIPARALLPGEMKGPYDCIFLAVKATRNRDVLKNLRPLLSDRAVLMVLQNGLTEEDVASALGRERVVGVTIDWGATFMAPGVIRQTSRGDFVVGELDGAVTERIERLAGILRSVEPVILSRNIIGHKWSKLLINASMSGMGTVCAFTYGEVMDHPVARKAALAALTEGAEVAGALGISLEPLRGYSLKFLLSRSRVRRALAERFLRIGLVSYRDLKASMWQDLEKNLSTEVDILNGYIVKKGEEAGIHVPVNRAITRLIREVERGERDLGSENLAYIPLPELPLL